MASLILSTFPIWFLLFLSCLNITCAQQGNHSDYPDWWTNDYSCIIQCMQKTFDGTSPPATNDQQTQALGCVSTTCNAQMAAANTYQALYIIRMYNATGSIYEDTTTSPSPSSTSSAASQSSITSGDPNSSSSSGISSGSSSPSSSLPASTSTALVTAHSFTSSSGSGSGSMSYAPTVTDTGTDTGGADPTGTDTVQGGGATGTSGSGRTVGRCGGMLGGMIALVGGLVWSFV